MYLYLFDTMPFTKTFFQYFSSFLRFKVIFQQSRNNEPKRCLFTT